MDDRTTPLEHALAMVKAAGYRVSKPLVRAKPRQFNAVGKPYSPLFDPHYRMKHKPSTAHLFKPYSDSFRYHLTS